MSHHNTPKPFSPARPLPYGAPAMNSTPVPLPARPAATSPHRKKHFSAAGLAALRANLQKARARMAAHGPTPRQIAANRANLMKANAQANKAFKYRPTPRRLAAARANLRQARAVRPTIAATYVRSRYSHLKHGLFAADIEGTLARLGEDPRAFTSLLERLERVLRPHNHPEGRAARRLAEALWRRQRLLTAKLHHETEAVGRVLDFGASVKEPGAEHLRDFGYMLLEVLMGLPSLYHREQRLVCDVERQLRAFLRLRVGGDPQFKVFTRDMGQRLDREEKLRREIEKLEQLVELSKSPGAGEAADKEARSHAQSSW